MNRILKAVVVLFVVGIFSLLAFTVSQNTAMADDVRVRQGRLQHRMVYSLRDIGPGIARHGQPPVFGIRPCCVEHSTEPRRMPAPFPGRILGAGRAGCAVRRAGPPSSAGLDLRPPARYPCGRMT